MKKFVFVILAAVATACGGHAATGNDTTGNGTDSTTDTATVQYTLHEDIAQMLMVGFRGQTVDSLVARDVRDLKVGGVILFEYDAPSGTRKRNVANPEQVRRLCADLQALAPGRLLIGIDQEGGNVSRLRTAYGFDANRSAKATASDGDDTVRRYARLCAEQLQRLGINLNFAPCADVDAVPPCPVIGGMERSFGTDAGRVAECCRIWIDEQSKCGVMSCLKHFPGHGSAKGDTHKGLVDVSATWRRSELEPYRRLIADGRVPMVMTAHVVNRNTDPAGLPASLSAATVSLLRDTLGFDGLIITDDMAMGAITANYGYAEAIAMAIEAGADMLCLSNNGSHYDPDLAPRTVALIEQLVAQGKVSEAKIHRAAERIRHFKGKLQ
ncbi:MAG: hypothetical protein K6F85_07685 [Bacteroidales bacterium]|nr:hypothetical protein [Bacteroidales bacterium]